MRGDRRAWLADRCLCTAQTRQMLTDHVDTRVQMDNLARTYPDCPAPRARIDGDFAFAFER